MLKQRLANVIYADYQDFVEYAELLYSVTRRQNIWENICTSNLIFKFDAVFRESSCYESKHRFHLDFLTVVRLDPLYNKEITM